jgi:hypothetical protein
MSVQKNYSCDLCGSSIADAGGIGIIHKANGEIEGVPVRLEGAGHHLCNRCVNGLKGMLFLPTQGEEHGR